MKKRVLSLLLALCLMLSLAPAAFAATGAGTEEEPYLVANESDLKTAVAAGGHIKLTDSFSIDDTLDIGKSIAIDGAGYVITANTELSPAINVSTAEAVSFSNVTISGAARGFDLLNTAAKLTLTGCVLNVSQRGVTCSLDSYDGMSLILDNTKINNSKVSDYDTQAVYDQNSRGLSLWGTKNSVVTLKNGSEINGFSYCINVSGPKSDSGVADTSGLVVTVENSKLRGWTGFNIWGSLATYNLTGSTVLGINTATGTSNSFSAITFNDDIYDLFAASHAENNILNITDSTITNYQNGECTEKLLRIDCGITALNLRGTVNFIDTTGNVSSALYLNNMKDPVAFLKNNVDQTGATVVCKTVGGAELPFAPTYNAYYYWDAEGGGFEGSHCEFSEIFAGNDYTLYSGEYIDLTDDVVLKDNVTATLAEGKGSFTLKLEGYSITGGKIILPGGTSVITDGENDALFAPADGCVINKTSNNDGTLTYASLGNAVAQVGTTYYETLADAVAAGSGQTVKLLKDVQLTSSVVISAGKTVKLDLNGNTITTDHTVKEQEYEIQVYGKLTLIDSDTVNPGKITTVSGSNRVWPNIRVLEDGEFVMDSGYITGDGVGISVHDNAKVTINNGKIDSAMYAVTGNGTDLSQSTTITINGGELVTPDNTAIYHPQPGTLNIYGGLISSATAIEMRTGTLNIYGGKIIGLNPSLLERDSANGNSVFGPALGIIKHATLSPLEVNIYGGEFDGLYAVYEKNHIPAVNGEKPPVTDTTINIEGGYFKTRNGGTEAIYSENITGFISGGYFTADPSAYLAEGKVLVDNDNAAYLYKVGDKNAEITVDTAVSAGEPKVTMPEGATSGITQSDIETAAKAPETTGSLHGAASGLTNDPQVVGTEDAAKEKLDEAGVTVAGDDVITVVVQPYLDIQVIAVDSANKSMELDISAKYNVIATTDPDDIQTDGASKNAAYLAAGETLPAANKPITITLPLPTSLEASNLFVKHMAESGTYYYAAAYADGMVSFVNPHGFSTFYLMNDTRTVTVTFNGTEETLTPDKVGEALPAATSAGQVFDGWTFGGVAGGPYKTLTDELLTALSELGEPIAAAAVFHTPSSGSGTYAVSVGSTENGAVTVSSARASKGDTVTISVKADSGYVLDTLTVTDKNGDELKLTDKGDGKYSFTMPASGVTVTAVFTLGDHDCPFKDVSSSHWFHDAVHYVQEAGLMNGVGEDLFAPDAKLTRGMMMTILARLDGADTTGSQPWYQAGLNWAVTHGVSDGSRPEAEITREQLATMLWRYAGSPESKASLDAFTDADAVSDWAATALAWAAAQEIVTGRPGGILDPAGTATRAEAAQMLMRFSAR